MDIVSLVVAFGIPVGVILAKQKGSVGDVLQSTLCVYIATIIMAIWSVLVGSSITSTSGLLGTIIATNVILGIIIVPLVVAVGYLAVAIATLKIVKMKP